MFTARNFSKINKKIFFKQLFKNSKKIARKLRLNSIEPDYTKQINSISQNHHVKMKKL